MSTRSATANHSAGSSYAPPRLGSGTRPAVRSTALDEEDELDDATMLGLADLADLYDDVDETPTRPQAASATRLATHAAPADALADDDAPTREIPVEFAVILRMVSAECAKNGGDGDGDGDDPDA